MQEPLPAGIFASELPVQRVLYEAESPIVYVSQTQQGQRVLAYLAEDSVRGSFTILAPLSNNLLSKLERGVVGVREALGSSWVWLHHAGAESKVWATTLDRIDQSHLPVPGTPLLPEHEPVLRTRALGDSIELGRVPASVVGFVAEATRKAFKSVLDYTMSRGNGRPTQEHKSLYDLPVQQFKFASFEIGFAAPQEGFLGRDEVLLAARKLSVGLGWAGDANRVLPADSDEERAAILRAVLMLTPPTGSGISEVQVSGTWVTDGRVKLTSETRRRVRSELRKIEPREPVEFETVVGRIGETDVDSLTCEIRDTPDGRDRVAAFDADALDDVLQFMGEGIRIKATGIGRKGALMLLDIDPLVVENSSGHDDGELTAE